MKRKILNILFLIIFLCLIVFSLRKVIFKGMAQFLIVEDDITFVENAFVLSGGAFDRGSLAAQLWKDNKIKNIICTGKNKSPDLKALNFDTLESDLTKLQILKFGVPTNVVSLLKEGTSTLEESNVILNYCLINKINEIVVVSSKFHTKRVEQVFRNKFEKENVKVFIVGAPSSVYNEMNWWKSEYGLIALNNEYLKQIYYFIKY